MKLHRLEATGFGPYADKVEVDFDRLDEAGVYLLTGPTGAGKTTVLDAISYALFGEIPRAGRTAKVVSDHRELATTPRVVLEATIGTDRIRINRSPKHDRPRMRGSGTATQDQSIILEVHRDGEWQVLGDGWNECNGELVRRVGMNADQFCQVVMLPQGDFAKFLRADVRSRQALLEKLFPGIDLAWMEEWFNKRARADRDARTMKQREIADRFEQIRTIATELASEDENPLPETTETEPALSWIERKEKVLADRSSAKEKVQLEAVKKADRADLELRTLTDRSNAIEKKKAAEANLAELQGKSAWRKDLELEIKAADNAALVRQLDSSASELEATSRAARLSLSDLETELRTNPLTLKLDSQRLPEAEAELRAEATTILNFENEELPRRSKLGVRTREIEAELVLLDSDRPESPRGKAKVALERAKQRETEAKRSLVEIRETRTHNMAAELARDLGPEEACPVCGSHEHPALAEGEGPQFSKEQEDAAQTAFDRAAAATAEAQAETSQVENRLVEQKTKLETELSSARETLGKLEVRVKELTAGASSIGERRDAVGDAADLIRNLLAARKTVEERTAAASEARNKADAEATTRGFDSVGEALEASRSGDALERLKASLADHDQRLAVASSQMAELEDVDSSAEVDLEPARAAATEASVRRDETTGEASIARENLVTFRQVTGEIPRLFAELEPLRESAAVSEGLRQVVNGENERRMKLSIFVLATRLRQVIDAANHHLQKMSDQRYELVYSGDLAGHGATSGLGIEVFDAHTSENRPTSSLSGGESFWASLSLALGLAEIVAAESGGKRIETLFIDEGFGTLDPESLGNVIDVIDSLRAGGRSVGLVSHVEEMKNRIPAQIQVSAGKQGSTLEVVV